MNISAPFIKRPVATTLLTIGLALSGILAFGVLPVAPLPNVQYPTLVVTANYPGASPSTSYGHKSVHGAPSPNATLRRPSCW